MHVITISEERGQGFEEELESLYVRDWREEKEAINIIIKL